MLKSEFSHENQCGISVIIPVNNEAENIDYLYKSLSPELEKLRIGYELIFIDDFSSDNTKEVISALSACDRHICYCRLSERSGQTSAISKGFQMAKNDIIITMDGDCQCDPLYIRYMLAKLNEGFDAVLGCRVVRKDGAIVRIFSYLGNSIINLIFQTKFRDIATPYRVFKKNVFPVSYKLNRGYHRFLPLFFNKRCNFLEFPICFKKRYRGKSHYNISKLFNCLASIILLLISRHRQSSGDSLYFSHNG